MKKYRAFHLVRVLLVVTVAVAVVSFVTMHLWNWLMPAVFGVRVITWAQALGLLVLSKILLCCVGRGGRGGRPGWKRDMKERWQQMSPEERARLRAGLRGRWGCGFEPGREDGNEQKPGV